ncbi:MAG TPA: (Fe-S)-binding protein [Saprospiraceae bacterium]|nr:(Fe-S)-binding protein [Saprospiraceae bacterium]
MIQSLVFILISFIALRFAYKRYRNIYQAIRLGHAKSIKNHPKRFKNMLLFALGQKKMFSRPISGVFHFFIYAAFILTQIETIEIVADGLLGRHRIFAGNIGWLYPAVLNMIEIGSVLALVATVIFLIRRNVIKLDRFHKPELKGWPFADANLILVGEIILVFSIFFMNGADQALQSLQWKGYPDTGTLILSSTMTQPLVDGLPTDWLIFTERFFWWAHYLVILGFIVYLPYSKHLHIFLAFPSSYFADLKSRGQMQNIPAIENEVRSMLGLTVKEDVAASERFGASDIPDLEQRVILQAYSCTECGRCTSVCPANITGKKLSPRKIVMDIRDRAEELVAAQSYAPNADGGYDITDGKTLFDRISREELYACTSCNACVEACPVLINPLETILELRRYDILMNSAGPQEWLPMFNSLENNQAAWALSEPRTQWIHND